MTTPKLIRLLLLGTLLVAGVLLACWVGVARLHAPQGKSPNQERVVLKWLELVPFREVCGGLIIPRISFEEWIEVGRDLDGAEAILLTLLESEDPRVDPAQIAYALGCIGGSNSVPALISALGSQDVWVRIESASSLGRLGDRRAVPALCQIVAKDMDRNVRANACHALGLIGDNRAEPYLREALHDKRSFVRRHASEALLQLRRKDDAGKGSENDSAPQRD